VGCGPNRPEVNEMRAAVGPADASDGRRNVEIFRLEAHPGG